MSAIKRTSSKRMGKTILFRESKQLLGSWNTDLLQLALIRRFLRFLYAGNFSNVHNCMLVIKKNTRTNTLKGDEVNCIFVPCKLCFPAVDHQCFKQSSQQLAYAQLTAQQICCLHSYRGMSGRVRCKGRDSWGCVCGWGGVVWGGSLVFVVSSF